MDVLDNFFHKFHILIVLTHPQSNNKATIIRNFIIKFIYYYCKEKSIDKA